MDIPVDFTPAETDTAAIEPPLFERKIKVSPVSLEGQMLGKYRVMEMLGRGGMAQVYRAYHPQLDRYVAIKVLRADLVDEGEFLARFQREARAVAALRHPNIVQVFDFDIQDDLYYMVMEVLEGDTLKARLNDYRLRGERMPLGEVVGIVGGVLAGLGYAHDAGLIHRDIKPANILLTARGQAVLTDFGIAQIVGGTRYTVSGALMGTLNYMAPEQGLQGRCDSRSDIYSLGIVLFEMLTGRPPFDADTPLAILMKHLNDPLPLPRQLEPHIPDGFERVVLKALSKNPEDRYASAGEMAAALAEAAGLARVQAQELAPLHPPAPLAEPAPPVFAGEERQALAGLPIAADETDASLGRRLEEALAAQEPPTALPAAALHAAPAPASVAAASIAAAGALAPQGNPAADPHAGDLAANVEALANNFAAAIEGLGSRLAVQLRVEGPSSVVQALQAAERNPMPVTTAGLTLAGLIVGGNLLMLFIASVTRNWAIYTYGWPLELLLVGAGLLVLMASLRNIWLLIPSGLLLGNGVLMLFYALSGAWGLWTYLWPLEPMLVFAVIYTAVSYSNSGKDTGPIAARWAPRLLLMAIALSVVAGGFGLIVRIISRLFWDGS